MTQPMYTLVARTSTTNQELLQSSKADVLRHCGRAVAQDTAPDADLLLIDPAGLAVASFDVWSCQWQPAA